MIHGPYFQACRLCCLDLFEIFDVRFIESANEPFEKTDSRRRAAGQSVDETICSKLHGRESRHMEHAIEPISGVTNERPIPEANQ